MERKFEGIWIPAELWLTKNLSLTEKVLYLEIKSLDNDFGCTATNKFLSERVQVNPTSISTLLKSLEEKGIIKMVYRDLNSFEGRTINVVYFFGEHNDTPSRNQKPPSKNQKGVCENQKHSNTISNTISNNLNINVVSKEPTLHQRLCAVWLNEIHIGWTFGAMQGKCITSIGEKIKKIQKAAGLSTDDTDVERIFRIMCQKLPEWYKDKDLQVINSKFNEIITEIKNQKNGNKQQFDKDNGQIFRKSV